MKKAISLLLSAVMLAAAFTGCSTQRPENKELVKLTVSEVTHSIFYAPMYAAINNGYFEEDGIEVELVNGLGADKTMTALLSGEADIGFMGPESTIYTYQQGNTDYVVNFAQLTQRAGNFLVSREKTDQFDWEMIRNKDVIGGRKGGMPQMILEYVLKLKGMDPEKDVNLVQNIDFANTAWNIFVLHVAYDNNF